MNALSLNKLSVAIGGKRVCDALDLELKPGRCVGILGANGIGKTTLLHTIAGLREPESGEIRISDDVISHMSRRNIAQQLGLLMQQHEDPFPASVLETALIGRHPHIDFWQWESPADISIAKSALDTVDMKSLEDRHIHSLSGGERRRLGIATILAQDPDIYLLDEPVDQLDPYYQVSILSHFQRAAHQKNKLIAMSLHDVNLAARFCDDLLMLFGNGESLFGMTYKVLNPENLKRLYNIPVRMITTDDAIVFIPE
ncbi:MAG: ABC transporter ATP-binding protein [Gammaproteobacteria bacterium]|nr:ABC transporter ATP-binding protein [Gammaproteobacteria bacterium]